MDRMSRWRSLSFAIRVLGCGAVAVLAERALAGRHIGLAAFGHRYELLNPESLAVAAFLPLLLIAALRSLSGLPPIQRALSLAARSVLVVLLAVALARPVQTYDATRISAVLLVDVSDSITDADLELAQRETASAASAQGADDLQIVTFASRPRREPSVTDRPPKIQRHARTAPKTASTAANASTIVTAPGARTDIQAALQLAYGLFAPGYVKRVAILSDGEQTAGDLLAEAARAQRLGIRLYHRVLERGAPAEVAVRELELPERIAVGESFELRAHVFATYSTRSRLRLYQDKLLNGLDGVRDVELVPGDNEVTFKSIVRSAGEVGYRLTLEPAGPDRFAENNAVSATAVVPGRPNVLVVAPNPEHVRALAQALSVADFDVDLRSAAAMPRSLGELSRYDFFILSDVPADQIALEQMDALERYVSDLGAGFMFTGGVHGYGLGGYQGTRMEQLLPVLMDSERRRNEQSLALALVIDCSGSMSGQKIELAKDAAKAAAELLAPDDSLGVIGFSGEPQHLVRMQSARNRLHIGQNIARLAAQGGTAIFPALDLAFQDLQAQSARIKHVILLTDGQTQESGIPELVQSMRAEGITLSAVGLGSDVNRNLLQQAAALGGGRAYFTSDPHNVPRIFVRETSTVGQNSVVEELVRVQAHEPADFLKGIDLESAPMLRGYVATRAKPRPAQVVLQSELGEPILARWRVGLGWALAWTSDVEPRWATDWLRWRGLASFFGQLVREHMRERRHDDLPMRATMEGEELLVTVDALGADDRFLNGLDSSVIIDGPLATDAERVQQTLALQQRAPGRYELRVPWTRYGSFALSAIHRKDDRVVAHSHAQLSNPYPAEYAARKPNRALLEQAAAITSGHALGSMRELFAAGDQHIEAHRELWPEFVMLALGLFLLDIALRRVQVAARERD
jgi:uncharacterized membrane protein/uncharacterized protein YegL